MKSAKGNKMIEDLLKSLESEVSLEDVVNQLKAVREIALEEKDPALVKILRLCYTYIEENGDFELGFLEEEGIEDMSDLEYLLQLILQSDKEANRKEIADMRDLLWDALY